MGGQEKEGVSLEGDAAQRSSSNSETRPAIPERIPKRGEAGWKRGSRDQPLPFRTSIPRVAGWGPGYHPPERTPRQQRGVRTHQEQIKLCLIAERACAAGSGGIIHSVLFHTSQEKHSRLLMLEFLNIQKAVML